MFTNEYICILYYRWNINGCSNLQLDDAAAPTATTRLCSKILTFFQVLILGPVTLVSTIVSVLLCPCCLPAMLEADVVHNTLCSKIYQLFSTCMTGWGLVYMTVLVALPLLAVFGSIILGVLVAFYVIVGVIRYVNDICVVCGV